MACLITWVLIEHTSFGFKVRMIGGNLRAARIAGLAVGKISLWSVLRRGGGGPGGHGRDRRGAGLRQ